MKLLPSLLAAGLVGALVASAPSSVLARSDGKQIQRLKPVKKAQARPARRVRPAREAGFDRPYAAPAYAAAAAYGGARATSVPNGGPGRYYLDPPTVGAAPERGEDHSPEGP